MSKPSGIILDLKSPNFTLDDAEQLARDLSAHIRQARLSITPTIKLFEGRVADWNLKAMFGQVYATDHRARYWSDKLMYRLQSEWSHGSMRLEVWCGSCAKFVQNDERCTRHVPVEYGWRSHWHYPVSITAESLLREQHKYRLRRGEGDKMLDNYNLMIRSLQQACQ